MRKFLEWHSKKQKELLCLIIFYAIWASAFTTVFFRTQNLTVVDKITFVIIVPLTASLIAIDALIVGIGFTILSIKAIRQKKIKIEQEKIKMEEIKKYGCPKLKIEEINNHTYIIKKGTYYCENGIVISEVEHRLEIEAGTTIFFGKTADIYCNGSLILKGTDEKPIILDAFDKEWKGIYVNHFADIAAYNTIFKNIAISSQEKRKAPIEIYYSTRGYPRFIAFEKCEFRDNVNLNPDECTAGALYIEGECCITIKNCIFTNNKAIGVGAIQIYSQGQYANINILNCIVSGNISQRTTAGILLVGRMIDICNTKIIANFTEKNYHKTGIGLHAYASDEIHAENNIIENNTSMDEGKQIKVHDNFHRGNLRNSLLAKLKQN